MTDLHRDLDRAAQSYAVPPGDLDAVVRRAGRRARRVRAAGGVAVLAALAATVFVALPDDHDDTNLAAGGEAAPTIGDDGISWAKVDPTSAILNDGRPATIGGDGSLYALSTAPGEADYTKALPLRVWRSTDGVDWTSSAEPTGDLYLSDLAARDDRLYAVGTGPATAATIDGNRVPEVRVGWSDDGAASWTSEALPIDFDAITEHATSIAMLQREVEAGADAAVAVVSISAALDVPEVLPAGDTAPDGWAITATGVDVLGPQRDEVCPAGTRAPDEPKANGIRTEEQSGSQRIWPTMCESADQTQWTTVSPQDARGVVRSYTWDQLGISGDMLTAVLGQPMVFTAADGTTFQRAALPSLDAEVGWMTLTAGEAGFDLIVNTVSSGIPATGELLHSVDGATWTLDRALPAELQWVQTAGMVDGHLTLLGADGRGRPLVIADDGAGGWRTTRPADLAGASASADSVGTAGDIGPLGIALVTTVYDEEGRKPGACTLLTSRDGNTWARHDLEELAGEPVGNVGRITVTADRIVVSVDSPNDKGQPVHHIALVGTPA